jgi:hypothetical protein
MPVLSKWKEGRKKPGREGGRKEGKREGWRKKYSEKNYAIQTKILVWFSFNFLMPFYINHSFGIQETCVIYLELMLNNVSDSAL